MNDLFYLSPYQLARIKPYFPLSHGVPRVDDLRVIRVLSTCSNAAYNGAMPPVNMVHTKHCIIGLYVGVKWGVKWGYSTKYL